MTTDKDGVRVERVPTPEALARRFHDLYETLAPLHGYETRPDTREFDLMSKNGKLMVVVCDSIIRQGLIPEAASNGRVPGAGLPGDDRGFPTLEDEEDARAPVVDMQEEVRSLRAMVRVKDKAYEALNRQRAELVEALKGVVSVADRKTVEFDRARAAIANAGESVPTFNAAQVTSHVEGYDCIRTDCQRTPGADCPSCLQRWSKPVYKTFADETPKMDIPDALTRERDTLRKLALYAADVLDRTHNPIAAATVRREVAEAAPPESSAPKENVPPKCLICGLQFALNGDGWRHPIAVCSQSGKLFVEAASEEREHGS